MNFDGLDVRPNSEESKMKAAQETNNPPARRDRSKVPKPVLSEGAAVNKPSLLNKITTTFLQGRNAKDVGTYVLTDVLIPTIIDGVANAAKAAIDGILYGDIKPGKASSYGNNKTNYGSLSRPGSSSSSNRGGVVARGGNNSRMDYNRVRRGFEQITISSRRDAEYVLQFLLDNIEQYDCVSIADYYEAFDGSVNVESRWTDSDWGWFNLNGVDIKHVPGGWMIDLPDPVKLG